MKVTQQAAKRIIIIITLKDFSVHINPGAKLTTKIEQLQLYFTKGAYIKYVGGGGGGGGEEF